jgi:hypothetical protein
MPVKIYINKKSSDEPNEKIGITRESTGYFGTYAINNTLSIRSLPPVNIDIFPSQLTKMLNTLSDDDVQEQACEIIHSLYHILNNLRSRERFTNYLAKLHVTEQEDKTGLIEWNFEKFRIGFSIAPDKKMSSYYLVSDDRVTDTFIMKTKRLGANRYNTLKHLVNYVLENT